MAGSLTIHRWLRAARTPRMIGIFFLFLLAALICVQLGQWQLQRSLERGSAQAEIRERQQATASAQPIDEVLAPQQEFQEAHLGKKVRVKGHYRDQVIVPGREIAGEQATLVVTDLVTDAGAHLPVVRGWLPAAEAGVVDGQVVITADITPPDGEITAVGYLANSEQTETGPRGPSLPGVQYHLSTAILANQWGSPTYTGYLVLADQDPAPLLQRRAPQPNLVKDSGRNWQNFAYAIEWFIFGGFALALWVKMVNDEAQARRVDERLAGKS
ncbi:MAG: SURF1 family protein [Bowdeniella nasicola]|nr:SURF1 family protein [Bowdeniella nasicola]